MLIKKIIRDNSLDELIRKAGIRATSRKSGISVSYIMYLLQGKRVASQDVASKLRRCVNKVSTNNKNSA